MSRDLPDSVSREPHGFPVRDQLARLAAENALLAAALAEARERLAESDRRAGLDPLTGLADEDALRGAIGRALASVERHGAACALLGVDLRDLGGLNACHGRIAGDAALSHAARHLRGLIRASDLVARHGAGFAILLDRLDPAGVGETGRRIADFLADQPLDLGGRATRIEVTVASVVLDRGDEAQALLGRLATALERAKFFDGPVLRRAG